MLGQELLQPLPPLAIFCFVKKGKWWCSLVLWVAPFLKIGKWHFFLQLTERCEIIQMAFGRACAFNFVQNLASDIDNCLEKPVDIKFLGLKAKELSF